MNISFPSVSKKHIRFGLILLIALIAGFLFNYLNRPETPTNKKDPYAGLFNRKSEGLIQEQTLLANKAVPVLKISNEREKTVQLSKLSISSTIENGVARTRYDMYFYNEQNRDLEAELQFPLADGQTISYFAMDVNGEMRSGVAVEKVKARMAYEATVRQGIDPGLIEKTQGNNFKLRVFLFHQKGQSTSSSSTCMNLRWMSNMPITTSHSTLKKKSLLSPTTFPSLEKPKTQTFFVPVPMISSFLKYRKFTKHLCIKNNFWRTNPL